jgi:hypothetical protein
VARNAFYSFHYVPDNWRASQVRNMGVVEGNHPVSDNDWEQITGKGDSSIRAWIDGQLSGRSCTIVLIGAATAGRKWIKYEIEKSWNDGKGLVGIYIHNLKDRDERQSQKGANPFQDFHVGSTNLSSIVKAYDPPYNISTAVYSHIKANLESWVAEAIAIRANR